MLLVIMLNAIIPSVAAPLKFRIKYFPKQQMFSYISEPLFYPVIISLRLRALQKKLDESAFNMFFEILWHILFPRQLNVITF
jgi:hypothetical protein